VEEGGKQMEGGGQGKGQVMHLDIGVHGGVRTPETTWQVAATC
jgi:hypothetical protein